MRRHIALPRLPRNPISPVVIEERLVSEEYRYASLELKRVI
jgi:hypothetical protein